MQIHNNMLQSNLIKDERSQWLFSKFSVIIWKASLKKKENLKTKSKSQKPHYVHSTVSCCVKKFLGLLSWIQNIFRLFSNLCQSKERIYRIVCGGIFGSLSDGKDFLKTFSKWYEPTYFELVQLFYIQSSFVLNFVDHYPDKVHFVKAWAAFNGFVFFLVKRIAVLTTDFHNGRPVRQHEDFQINTRLY